MAKNKKKKNKKKDKKKNKAKVEQQRDGGYRKPSTRPSCATSSASW